MTMTPERTAPSRRPRRSSTVVARLACAAALGVASLADADATVTFGSAGGWDGGYTGSIVIRNDGSAPIADWRVEWDGGPSVGSLWNGTYTLAGNHAVVVNAGWNGTIAPGASVSLGFTGVGILTENVSNCTVNGVPATVAYSGAAGGGGGEDGNGGDGTGDGDAPGSGASGGPFACIGDLDGNGTIDGADLGVLLGEWGESASGAADLNGDGAVDGVDLGALLGAWGECPPRKVIVGYWIEWGIYGRNYQPADTPFDKVTHLNYAFADISPDGRVVPYDTYAALEKNYPGDTWDQPVRGTYNQLNNVWKRRFPHLRTLISVGGWTLSGRFSDVALTPASRATFADSCVDFLRAYGFDGIDIDWEYPVAGGLESNTYRPQDKENFTLLMRDVRQALDAAGADDGRRYLLTIAAPAGYDKVANMEPAEYHRYLDWINVMTYDYFGAWNLAYTANHGAFEADLGIPSANPDLRTRYNTKYAMQQYLDAGVPASKLVLGLPFYGRGWRGVGSANHGLHQPGTGVPPGTWDDWSSGATGVNDFTQIDRDFLAPGSGYVRHWDPVTKTPFIYNPSAYGGHWIGYDDAESVTLKLDWAMEQGFGGAMIWELTGDRDEVLLDAVGRSLGARQPSP